MELVTVTNRNEEAFSKKFDGQVYNFPSSQPVTIPERVAGWIFAYGKTDAEREAVLVRNGWNRLGHLDKEKAKAILGKFVFNTLEDGVLEKKADGAVKSLVNRVMTGINAMSVPEHKAERNYIKLPGSASPLAPPVPSEFY